jgi:NTE family protein
MFFSLRLNFTFIAYIGKLSFETKTNVMIKNLAFKGGGVKSIAYVGALHELQAEGILQKIERVSGTSAGALLAGMLCAGYNVDGIEKLMRELDFRKFEKGFNPFRILSRYGLHSGDYILEFIHAFLNNSPMKFNPNVTFSQMAQAGCKKLYVFACNLNKHTVEEFSADLTPHAIVAEAIRASMSIPIFFKAWQFSNGIPDKDIYVDGGVVYNYPLSFFDDKRFNTHIDVNYDTIGLYLFSNTKTKFSKPETRKHEFRFNKPVHYTKHLFEALLDAQEFIVNEDKEQVDRSIMIDDLGFPATDFDLKDDDKNHLLASGRQGARDFIQKNAKAS